MLGDLDLIHHVARDSKHGAELPTGGPDRMSRLSLDSSITSTSVTGISSLSSSLSSSFGAASPKSSFLLRQFSQRTSTLPTVASAPVNIPIMEGQGPASANGPQAFGDTLRGRRMPVLVRSLSKGLSASMDFR